MNNRIYGSYASLGLTIISLVCELLVRPGRCLQTNHVEERVMAFFVFQSGCSQREEISLIVCPNDMWSFILNIFIEIKHRHERSYDEGYEIQKCR